MSGVLHTLVKKNFAFSILTDKEFSTSQAQGILKRISNTDLEGDDVEA